MQTRQPVQREASQWRLPRSRDGAGCVLGLLALMGLGAFLFLALLAALAR